VLRSVALVINGYSRRLWNGVPGPPGVPHRQQTQAKAIDGDGAETETPSIRSAIGGHDRYPEGTSQVAKGQVLTMPACTPLISAPPATSDLSATLLKPSKAAWQKIAPS
jgi:hypothetical protein